MSKTDTTVDKLVTMIKDGELRLPEMQRRYVWPATRVRDLLDSLYRGYPSGTILVWETEQEMPSRDLAIEQGTSPFKGHKLLLDGQQRLTSLSAILRGKPVVVRGRRKPIEILFNLDHPEKPAEWTEVNDEAEDADDTDVDLEEEEGPNIQERLRQRTFVVASKQMQANPVWVPVTSLFRDEVTDGQILKPLVGSFDDPNYEKYTKRLQRVRRIRDYQYVMHVLDKSLSYEEVAEIFVRVNSLGVKLRGSDLALAQITSRWRDSLKLFEEFQEECEESWFTLDLGLLVRALVVFATNQSRFNSVSTIPVEQLKKGWEKAKSGIRFAVNFLRANAGVEDESLLSSPLFIITIGYYALQTEMRLAPGDVSALKRWLYLGNVFGHYSGSSETTLDGDLNLISRGGGPMALLDTLKQQVGRFEVHPGDLAGRGQRSALFSLAYLALKARGARDWHTHLGLSLTHQGRFHFIEHHHIFPKAILKKHGASKSDTNEIANMAFVSGGTNRNLWTRPPEHTLAELQRTQGAEAFAAHCLPLDESLWKVENYSSFLEYRRAQLAKAINEFIASDGGGTSTVDLESLIAGGENDRVEFKASLRWDFREGQVNKGRELDVAKAIAAFLNSEGGTLLIGVQDDGEIVGLERDYKTLGKRPDRDGYQQALVNVISTALGKAACATLRISVQPIGGREICVVHAAPSTSPVYLTEGGQSKFFVRTGNTSQDLGTRDAVAYIAQHWRAW